MLTLLSLLTGADELAPGTAPQRNCLGPLKQKRLAFSATRSFNAQLMME